MISSLNRDHRFEMPIEEWMEYVDRIEKQAVNSGTDLVDLDTKHRFVGGIYIREVSILPNQMIISNIHNTEHPFVVFEGDVTVRTHKGFQRIVGPYLGKTVPMTRRILHSDNGCRWATFHVMEKPDETVDEIMNRILLKRINPLLSVTELARIQEKILTTNLLK
jgi:hypothetical protein